MKKIGIILPAGGSGTRMGTGTPKQFMPLDGIPVLVHTVRAFAKAVSGADIVVALPAGHFETWAAICIEFKVPPHKVCEGGETRFDSVRQAIGDLDAGCDYIAVHDAVRPLVSRKLIRHTVATAKKHGTAIPVTDITDSIRRLTVNSSYPVDRAEFRAVQTPQVFRADILRAGYEKATGCDFTDDAAVVESVGYNIKLSAGEKRNIKITNPVDIIVAEAILKNDRQ